MTCLVSCAIGIGLISSSVLINTSNLSYEKIENFKRLLTNEQLDKYNYILNERANIYLHGFIYGLLLTLIVYFIINKILDNKTICICLLLLTTLISQVVFYMLYPKKYYMLQVLNNKKQIDAWLDIYLTMRYQYIIGFFIGFIGYLVLLNVLV